MKKLNFVFIFVLLLIIFICPTLATAAEEYIEGAYDGYIVKVKDNTMPKRSFAILSNGVRDIGQGYYVADTLEEAQNIAHKNSIQYIEPNYYLTLYHFPSDGVPNDTYYANQWNLEKMNVLPAWYSGMFGEGAKVAVIDSGLVVGHEDIDYTNVITGSKEQNFTVDGALTETYDQTGHGSFVSGIIAAQINNGKGISGMTDKVEIVPLKCFTLGKNATVEMIVSAIYLAIEMDCDVINMSFGMYSYSETLEIAINAAADKGIIMVAAAGNDGKTELSYPAAYNNVIGVGSVDEELTVSDFSQRNESVFVTAPGEWMTSLKNTSESAYSCSDLISDSDRIENKKGTSYSAACVTAMAAIAKSIDKDITVQGFKMLLMNSSTDLGNEGYDTFYGYGLVNVGKFVEQLQEEYSIILYTNGGVFAGGTVPPDVYSVTSTEITLTTPIKENYYFVGWYDNEDLIGENLNTIPVGSIGDKIFYAKWQDATDTNLTSVSVAGFAGTLVMNEDGITYKDEFVVALPAQMVLPTDATQVSITAEDAGTEELPGATAVVSDTVDGGVTWRVIVTAKDAVTTRVYIIRVRNSLNPAPSVVEGQETQTIVKEALVAPASYDGLIAAVSYNAYIEDVSGWFEDNEESTLTYEISEEDAQGAVEIVNVGDDGYVEGQPILTFTPVAEDCDKIVCIKIKANDGEFYSDEVTIFVTVNPIPVSNSIISMTSATYDKYINNMGNGDITIEVTPYGNSIENIKNGKYILIKDIDYTMENIMADTIADCRINVTLKNTYLAALSTVAASGYYTITLEFSAGDSRNFTLSVIDTTPLPAVIPIIIPNKNTVITIEGEGGSISQGNVVSSGQSITPEDVPKKEPVFELFRDVNEKEWYTDALQFVVDRGLFGGTGDGNFSPKEKMTRGMFVTVLGRLAEVDVSLFTSIDFNDVEDNKWYTPFVGWAFKNELVGGYGNGSFAPNSPINREQIVVIMYRFAKLKKINVSVSSNDKIARFNDLDEVAYWAEDAIKWAVSKKVINGKPGNLLDPKGDATRAEVATIFQNFIQKILN